MLRGGTSATVAAVVGILAFGAATAQGAEGWSWPVRGEVLTGYQNGDDPYAGGQHRGIDIGAAHGAPVAAAAGGTVRFAGVAGSSGLTVSIRTADRRFDTSYLHLSSVSVREGDGVERGGRIGAVGTSGRRSTAAPHLHFGVREAGSRHAYRDPLDFLPPLGTPPSERPRGGPLPVGAPVRVGPAPAPAPSPARRRAARRRPVRVPAGRRIRVPAGRRVRVPAGGPARVPERSPRVVLPRLAPARVPRGAPARAPAGAPLPATGPAPLPAAAPQRVEAPSRRGPAAAARSGGPDLGWALACAGLLLGAACLGGRSSQRSRRGALRIVRWSRVRPLLGRR